MDTLIIAAILGTTQAGIYAAGTRYLLIGLFTAEAIMQVLGPRISALLAVASDREGGRSLYAIGTAWQTSITWSVYLIVIVFSTPLLRVFGPEYVAAGPGARLAVVRDADLVAVRTVRHDHPHERPGPTQPVQRVHRGRRSTSLGNFLLVPALRDHRGRRHLGGHARDRRRAAGVPGPPRPRCPPLVERGSGRHVVHRESASVSPPLIIWLVLGPTAVGLVAATVVGTGRILARVCGDSAAEIHLDTLMRSLLPSGRRRRPCRHGRQHRHDQLRSSVGTDDSQPALHERVLPLGASAAGAAS